MPGTHKHALWTINQASVSSLRMFPQQLILPQNYYFLPFARETITWRKFFQAHSLEVKYRQPQVLHQYPSAPQTTKTQEHKDYSRFRAERPSAYMVG